MIASFVVVLAVLSSAHAKITFPSTWEEFSFMNRNSMDNLFSNYLAAFEKKYQDEKTRLQRFELFASRVKKIFDWNDNKNAQGRTFLKGINQFSDMTEDERRGFVMSETKADVSLINKFLVLLH